MKPKAVIPWAIPPLWHPANYADPRQGAGARAISANGNVPPASTALSISDSTAGIAVAGTQWLGDYSKPWATPTEFAGRDLLLKPRSIFLFPYSTLTLAAGSGSMNRVQSTLTYQVKDTAGNILTLATDAIDCTTRYRTCTLDHQPPPANSGQKKDFLIAAWRIRWQLQVDFDAAAPAITTAALFLRSMVLHLLDL